MSVDASVDPPPDSKSTRKRRKSQLKVVFDTNALYVTPTSLGSASDLVRQEIVSLILDSKYPDLEILWYLPEVVRHERQYQMQAEALKLRYAINKIERLLGHNLALTDQVLLGHVESKINEKEVQLGLQEIALDHSLVDWGRLIHSAAYRIPPFQPGENEKGFRDALVAESFLQLLASSPKTPKLWRVVLVTSDDLLTQAIKERIPDWQNASVISGVEELKGLINTIVSDVGEDFIAQLTPKAAKLFFVSGGDKDTLFYKESVGDRLKDKFKAELTRNPEGTSFRDNGTWRINLPNFSRKDGRRIFWTSRITIELEAGTFTKGEESKDVAFGTSYAGLTVLPSKSVSLSSLLGPVPSADWFVTGKPGSPPYASILSSSERKVVTHKGKDIFDILWSAELTMAKDLKKGAIEDMKHIELNVQPIS